MSIFPACCLRTMCMPADCRGQGKSIKSPGSAAIDSYRSPCGRWELHWALLQEQPVLLTSEPSLQPHNLCYWRIIVLQLLGLGCTCEITCILPWHGCSVRSPASCHGTDALWDHLLCPCSLPFSLLLGRWRLLIYLMSVSRLLLRPFGECFTEEMTLLSLRFAFGSYTLIFPFQFGSLFTSCNHRFLFSPQTTSFKCLVCSVSHWPLGLTLCEVIFFFWLLVTSCCFYVWSARFDSV